MSTKNESKTITAGEMLIWLKAVVDADGKDLVVAGVYVDDEVLPLASPRLMTVCEGAHKGAVVLMAKDDASWKGRFEHKLDALLAALAAEGEEGKDAPATSLDGELVPGDRDQSQSLG